MAPNKKSKNSKDPEKEGQEENRASALNLRSASSGNSIEIEGATPEEKLVEDATRLKENVQTVNKTIIDSIRSPELKGKVRELEQQSKDQPEEIERKSNSLKMSVQIFYVLEREIILKYIILLKDILLA